MAVDQTLLSLRALVFEDLVAVHARIREKLHSPVPLINELGDHLLAQGGKQLRPLLVLLSAKTCGYVGEQHIDLATLIEFIHSATLLHDDVVDLSKLRRGQPTANALWGNAAPVLVGDFLYSRAFQMMVDCGSMAVMALLSDTTNAIAEGEVLQLSHTHDPDISFEDYFEVIRLKTAKLFEAAAKLGAILSDYSANQQQAMANYGHHLGTAFQLIDDVLDYTAPEEISGKALGDDLAEGKTTLPLIYAMQNGNTEQRSLIRLAIEEGRLSDLPLIQAAIKESGAIDHTLALAKKEAALACAALSCFEDSPYKQGLELLANFAVGRQF